ncbi:MAG: hypothetical protein Roseis2KO_31070 [Roseivirga sp.]
MSQDSLVKRLLSGNSRQRSEAFHLIYSKCFPKVRAYVLKNSGSLDEAKDLFQETITIAYHNLLEGKFRAESTFYQYVVAIARNLWLMRIRKQTLVTTPLEDTQIATNDTEQVVNSGLINHLLASLGESCRSILKSFYYDGEKMEEIAASHNLGSAQAAKTKKLRCMKKLTTLIKSHGLKNHHFIQ